MKFINQKTGLILEPTEEVAKLMKESDVYKEYKKQEMTIAQIKKLLDEKGIEYNPKAKKEELIALL